MADSSSGDASAQRVPTPGGSGVGVLMGRRPPTAISTGRLPSMRSRDLTLGGVKKVRRSISLLGRIMVQDSFFPFLSTVFVFSFF